MSRRIHVSDDEEDTWSPSPLRTCVHLIDTCHMRRRTHVIWGGGYKSYEVQVHSVPVFIRLIVTDWVTVCQPQVCVKRDLVCVKRDLVCVKRDLVCVKRDLVCVKRDLVSDVIVCQPQARSHTHSINNIMVTRSRSSTQPLRIMCQKRPSKRDLLCVKRDLVKETYYVSKET